MRPRFVNHILAIVLLSRIVTISAVLFCGARAHGGEAAKIYKEGQKAERAGEIVRAYLLYAKAAALDPHQDAYWARSQALRTRASMKALVLPRAAPRTESSRPWVPPESSSLSPEDLSDIRRMKPPPELKAQPGRKTLELRGDLKSVWEQTARAYGLDVVFDGDYQPGSPIRLRIEDAGYRVALRQMEAVTSSFLVPLSEKLFLVANDTPQKRAELEPTIAVTVPIPNTVTVQEAQETARSVQQAMEILKLTVDSERRLVFMRDRASKVLPAKALLEQLSHSKAEVEVDVQLMELDRSSFVSYGLLLPTMFPIAYLGGVLHSFPQLASDATRLLTFGGGQTLLGLGIASAELFANMNRSSSRSLMQAQMRSLDGATATFHVGDKFPVTTGTFVGGTGFYTPPQFNFEDLGLSLKITPHVHGFEEVSLDIESEFKVLAGESLNGIPVISNRKLTSKVRLKNGEWAMVAGLMNVSEAKNISGLAGLSSLPVLGRLLRQNTNTVDSTEVVLLLKPRLLSPPPAVAATPALYIGTEARLQTPL